MCSKASSIVTCLLDLCVSHPWICQYGMEEHQHDWNGPTKNSNIHFKLTQESIQCPEYAGGAQMAHPARPGESSQNHHATSTKDKCWQMWRSASATSLSPKRTEGDNISSVSRADYRNYNFSSKIVWDWVNLFLAPWPKPTPLWQPKICLGSKALPSCMSILKNKPTALLPHPPLETLKTISQEWSIFWQCLSGHLNIITIELGRTGVDPQ